MTALLVNFNERRGFNHMLFTESRHCKCRIHCRTCRDLEGGRAWRKSLAAVFDLPGGEIDFICPFGKDWGYVGEGKPKMTIAELAERKRNCVPCKKKNQIKESTK